MNRKLLLETIKDKERTRRKLKEKVGKIKNFSWVIFFAGEEFNQELSGNQELQKKISLIDFCEERNQKGE
jgi:hypothetical protein